MTKDYAIKRLELIKKHSEGGNYNYKINARNWIKADKETGEVVKSRIYFSITETRTGSKHCKERDYGYIDTLTGEYFPGNSDLNNNYDFGGNGFKVEETAKEKKVVETIVKSNITEEDLEKYAAYAVSRIFEDETIRIKIAEIIKSEFLEKLEKGEEK